MLECIWDSHHYTVLDITLSGICTWLFSVPLTRAYSGARLYEVLHSLRLTMKQVYAAQIRKVCFHSSTEVTRYIAVPSLANISSYDYRVAICNSARSLYRLPLRLVCSILCRDHGMFPFSVEALYSFALRLCVVVC